jgi:hypothetical protein
MTMSAGWQRKRVQSRAFFVPQAKCQALPLACQALDLKTQIIYWFAKVLSMNHEPRTMNRS